jgi:hypothetical protein
MAGPAVCKGFLASRTQEPTHAEASGASEGPPRWHLLVSPASRVLAVAGPGLARRSCRTLARTTGLVRHQHRPCTLATQFFAAKVGRYCLKDWPQRPTSGALVATKRLGRLRVVAARGGGRAAPDGQAFWQSRHTFWQRTIFVFTRIGLTMTIDEDANALWDRFKTLPDQHDIGVIEFWAKEKRIIPSDIRLEQVGRFQTFPAMVIFTDATPLCLPLLSPEAILDANNRHSDRAWRNEVWRKVDWFYPPYIRKGLIWPLLKSVKSLSAEHAAQQFEHTITSWYTLLSIAIDVCQVFPTTPAVAPDTDTIAECILGYFSGFKNTAIAALIPCVEAAINRMLALDMSSASERAVGDRVRYVMHRACSHAGNRFYYKGMWVPQEYEDIDFLGHLDEFVYMIQTFESWLTRSFFARIDAYRGPSGLNRHHFAHGKSAIWKRPTNFHRLIGILEAICFIESMNNRGTSAWFPDLNDAAAEFCDEILFRSKMQADIRSVPKALRACFGRLALAHLDCLVPGRLPNGVLSFRLEILAKAAHADIIQPLSEAGWACDVSEPDAEREFLIVRATRYIARGGRLLRSGGELVVRALVHLGIRQPYLPVSGYPSRHHLLSRRALQVGAICLRNSHPGTSAVRLARRHRRP